MNTGTYRYNQASALAESREFLKIKLGLENVELQTQLVKERFTEVAGESGAIYIKECGSDESTYHWQVFACLTAQETASPSHL